MSFERRDKYISFFLEIGGVMRYFTKPSFTTITLTFVLILSYSATPQFILFDNVSVLREILNFKQLHYIIDFLHINGSDRACFIVVL